MTLQDIIKMTMDMSVGGYINGEKFTQQRLRSTFSRMLDTENSNYIFQIALPDGWWFCKAIRRKWGYDLIVPDTREQEKRIKSEFFE